MRVWTVHPPREPGEATPVLLKEGFAWGAFLLALPWLLWHRLWLEAMAYLGLVLLLGALLPDWAAPPAALALQFLLGVHAQDLRRAALARRGRPATLVVAAADEDSALARLMDARPDLLPRAPA